jgi:hypothetical protein
LSRRWTGGGQAVARENGRFMPFFGAFRYVHDVQSKIERKDRSEDIRGKRFDLYLLWTWWTYLKNQ